MECRSATISTGVSDGEHSGRAVSTDKGSENEENSFHIKFQLVSVLRWNVLYTNPQKRQQIK
jgi:hypothetical protein